MRRAFAVFMAGSLLVLLLAGCGATPGGGVEVGPSAERGDAALAAAYESHARDLQVEASGVVARLLPDDVQGSRHQRFIVRLASGQTLLLAHNIDVAPRVEDLRVGDAVAFCGVYEWSPEGGTVHWTHRDPDGVHVSGWIRHGGKSYR